MNNLIIKLLGILFFALLWLSKINVVFAAQYQLSYLDKIEIVVPSSWNGTDDFYGDDDICVYADTSPDSRYAIEAYMTSRSSFGMTKSGGAVLAFSVEYKEAAGSGGEHIKLGYHSFEPVSGAHLTSTSCAGGTELKGNLKIVVTEMDFAKAIEGTYSGTLIVVIGPPV